MPDVQLLEALKVHNFSQLHTLYQGITRYNQSPVLRQLDDLPVLWQKGSTLLRDYSVLCQEPTESPTILFIPSLINRYYVLDLDKEYSFLRYLSQHNIPSMVLDWQEPEGEEIHFHCEDYIINRIIAAIHHAYVHSHKPIILAGYCLGGIMAMAAALQPEIKEKVQAMALFATPWDFHAETVIADEMVRPLHITLETMMQHKQSVPKEMVHQIFYNMHSMTTHKRFQRFATMTEGSAEAKEFIRIEQWANDGVPMATGVAQDCFVDWVGNNTLMTGDYTVGRVKIRPERLTLPVFLAVPQHDKIVPVSSSNPLIKNIPNVYCELPPTGHVGMVAGLRAKDVLWNPFLSWLKTL